MEFEHVLTLTTHDFGFTIGRKKFIAVLFHDPDRTFSGEFVFEFRRAAELLAKHDHYQAAAAATSPLPAPAVKVNLGVVDVSQDFNKYIVTNYRIFSYPSLILFKDRGMYIEEYKGPRDFEGMVHCLNRLTHTLPPAINSLQDITDLTLPHSNNILIVGVFPHFSGDEHDNFLEVAEIFKWEFDFYRINNHEGPPVVKLFNCLKENERYEDTHNFDVDALVHFIKKNTTPLVTLCRFHPPQFVDKFFFTQWENDKAMLFINLFGKEGDDFASRYRKLANKYSDISFMLGEDENRKEALLKYCDLITSEEPILLIWNRCGKFYAKLDFKYDYDIEGWMEDYKAERVTEYKKSDPIPQINDGLVKVVVGNNFDEMVMNSAKIVLLELYRSIGGEFEERADIVNHVATHFMYNVDVLIVKLDETRNDIRSVYPEDLRTHRGAPTLYLITPEGKIKLYREEFTREGIINFIMRKSEKRHRLA